MMSAALAAPPPQIGQSLARVEGPAKVRGQALYAAEFCPNGMAYGTLIQSSIANFRLTNLNLTAARGAPGLIDILTRYNAPRFALCPDGLQRALRLIRIQCTPNEPVGEIGIVGAPAAVANAVFHTTGKRVRELPITPDKLI